VSYEAAVEIVARLRSAGHEALLAGGCVRDRVLGLTPKDYDVATSAEPDAVRRAFRHARAVGEAFGVVLVPMRGAPIEVATFREEWGYSDGRRPDGVRFSDARHDAQRRDFTVNALFADPLPGERGSDSAATTRELPGFGRVIDHVGGLADLDGRVLRAVGDASERFNEDYLRMLRAVRFAARLGLTIEATTGRAIRASARLLGQVARERIGAELTMMLAHPTRADAAARIQALRLDGPALNEDPIGDDATPARLSALPDDASPMLALAAWLLDRHRPEASLDASAAWDARPVLRRLRRAVCLSNADHQAIVGTLDGLRPIADWDGLALHAKKRALARPHAPEALRLAATMADLDPVARESADLCARGVAPEPWVTGGDLIDLGLTPGPAFKAVLDTLYDAQLDGELADRAAAIARLRALHGGG
jgi:tRNA nucleotidyltransferase/poly(A) polymerase